MTDHYITYQRVSAARGIYSPGDYMATYVPCGPRGKRGGAVAPSTLLRVRKNDLGWWTAEVIVPGTSVTIREAYAGVTRDHAVNGAVSAYSEEVAA